jgi:RecB family endonuclease NucS
VTVSNDDPGDAVRSLVAPAPGAARDVVAGALERGDLLAVVGRCTVAFDGRASGELGPGERHLLVKPDGTALVHGDDGQRPRAWVGPGGDVSASVVAGDLRVRATGDGGDDSLTVAFEALVHVGAFDVTDDGERTVAGTEADLRERVLADPDLVEPGFTPLATERETPAGPVDVYGEDREGRAVVVELKRRRAGPDAVGQLERYVEALERDLHIEAVVRGILVAPSATDRARELLAERGLAFASVDPT